MKKFEEFQEKLLKDQSDSNRTYKDIIFYYAVKRDFFNIKKYKNKLLDIDDKITYWLIELYMDGEKYNKIFQNLYKTKDLWIYYTFLKYNLEKEKITKALEIAREYLLIDDKNTTLFNLIIKYLVNIKNYKIAYDIINISLSINPYQKDIKRIEEKIKNNIDMYFNLYLSILPKYEEISFYIPVYNVEKYIDSSIKGIASQNYPLENIYVIDDKTKDNSIKIAQNYPVKIIRHEVNKGLAAVRNTAFLNIKSKYIGTVDTDAYPDINYTKYILMEMENKELNVCGAGGKLIELNSLTSADKWRTIHMAQNYGEYRIYMPDMLFGSNNIFLRDAVLKISGFNEKYRTNFEDVDISFKLKEAGYEYIYIPDAKAYHMRTDTIESVLKTRWNWNFWTFYNNGFYKDKYTFINKMHIVLDWVINYLSIDISQNNRENLYIDFLYFFYDAFLDINYLISKNKLTLSEAKYIQDNLLMILKRVDKDYKGDMYKKIYDKVNDLYLKNIEIDKIDAQYKDKIKFFIQKARQLIFFMAEKLYSTGIISKKDKTVHKSIYQEI